jgi:DsbC/DsbD-like thiol-disulfide interchange protein
MHRVLAFLFLTFGSAPALAGASAWQEIAPGVTARLVSADRLDDGVALAGLELRLPEGTKTYWRVPGETGIPTEIDAAGSVGVRNAMVHWPFPEIERGQGYLDYVYRGVVVLPFEFEADETGSVLSVAVTLGLCSDICVPASASLTLPLDFSAPDAAQAIRLEQAMTQTPILWDQPEPPLSGVTLGPGGTLFLEGVDPRIDAENLIAEVADPAVLFEMPQKSPDGKLWQLQPLGGAVGKGLEGSPVQLTFLTPMGPYAVSRTIVSSDPA